MKRFLLLYLSAVLLALGCAQAPTKPPAEAQNLFRKLYNLDPALTLEVGKLPDWQGKVDEKQILALNRFIDLISNADTQEKANLDNLLKVGKPEIRRYSTPLETIFWLLEKDEYKPVATPSILQFSLKELLDKGWDFTEKQRWKNFEAVTDRLNAPELVNHYQRAQLNYDWEGKVFQVLKRGAEGPGDPHYLFYHKEGTCRDFAAFSVYCLKKAGYEAKVHFVENPDPRPQGRLTKHRVCLFVENGKEYIMDNGRPDKLERAGIIPIEDYRPFSRDLKPIYIINNPINKPRGQKPKGGSP